MAEKWYYARGAEQFGPFSATQLKELAAGEQLRPQDTVWKEGMEHRVLAVKVRHLFPPIQPKAPPAQPGGRTVPVPSPPRPPSKQLSPQAPGLAAASVPRSNPLEVQAVALEPRSMIPDGLELVSIEDGPTAVDGSLEPATFAEPERPQVPHQEAVKKRRVLGVKGGVISSQDGEVVKYRKQCLKCRYADTSLTTMRIRSGVTRVNFFCPKCKKNQQCEIQGVG
jgi:hypothetical protein